MICTRKNILDFLTQSKESFMREFSATKLGLFGSYARDDYSPTSDIDIVVELQDPDMFALIGIKQTIEDAFSTKVDIVRLRNDMNPSLRHRIEKDAMYV